MDRLFTRRVRDCYDCPDREGFPPGLLWCKGRRFIDRRMGTAAELFAKCPLEKVEKRTEEEREKMKAGTVIAMDLGHPSFPVPGEYHVVETLDEFSVLVWSRRIGEEEGGWSVDNPDDLRKFADVVIEEGE